MGVGWDGMDVAAQLFRLDSPEQHRCHVICGAAIFGCSGARGCTGAAASHAAPTPSSRHPLRRSVCACAVLLLAGVVLRRCHPPARRFSALHFRRRRRIFAKGQGCVRGWISGSARPSCFPNSPQPDDGAFCFFECPLFSSACASRERTLKSKRVLGFMAF